MIGVGWVRWAAVVVGLVLLGACSGDDGERGAIVDVPVSFEDGDNQFSQVNGEDAMRMAEAAAGFEVRRPRIEGTVLTLTGVELFARSPIPPIPYDVITYWEADSGGWGVSLNQRGPGSIPEGSPELEAIDLGLEGVVAYCDCRSEGSEMYFVSSAEESFIIRVGGSELPERERTIGMIRALVADG